MSRRQRWALVLTSVASLMVALDVLVVSTALSTIRHAPPRLDPAARVDRQRLQPELRGPADDRLGARRPLRSPAPVRRRARRCSSPHRRRARLPPKRRLSDRGAGAPGSRRRGRRATVARAAQRRVPAGAPRPGARHLQRHHRSRRARRSGRRRRGHAGTRVAVDLLAERADRADRDPARAAADRGELRTEDARSTSRGSRSSPAPRSGSSGVSCAATAPAGAASRCSARWLPGRRASRSCSSRGSCARASRCCRCGCSARAAFAAGNAATFLMSRVAVQRRVLHGAVPADHARSVAARRRAAAAAVDRDAVHRRADRRRADPADRRAAADRRRAAAAGRGDGLDRADRAEPVCRTRR